MSFFEKLDSFRHRFMWVFYKWMGTKDGDKIQHRNEITEQKRNELNHQGKQKNWVYCYICGDSGLWKASHYIGFTHCTPYCEQCHNEVSNIVKIKAMYTLVENWYKIMPDELFIYRGFGGYARVFLLSLLGILVGQ
jgi:hypothetical protein